jgi:hypothetical protein
MEPNKDPVREKRVFRSHFILENPIYQDRLGTNTGKALKKERCLSQAWRPAGITPRNLVPDVIVPGVSANVVRDGYDLLRRLGRLDLARHYPELGVTDVCGTASKQH